MDLSPEPILIGEDQDPRSAQDLTPVPPGTVFPIDQDLYFESGGPWKKGGSAGEAHGSGISTGKNLATCSVTFAFNNDGTIVAEGLLPIQGKKLGAGELAVTGGTGKYDKASGRVGMETNNPKRWSFVI